MIDGDRTDGGFSLVEHPMSARALAAPLHRHLREDEYSYVLEGQVGALLGDEVLVAGPGDLVFKPRNQWHTFWNAGDEPARILEIISPAGFERFFEELVDLGGVLQAGPEVLAELGARYELEFDLATRPRRSQPRTPPLTARHFVA
jgi:mannose-6-phosphate isomerase-like protein (cupin superfamily)